MVTIDSYKDNDTLYLTCGCGCLGHVVMDIDEQKELLLWYKKNRPDMFRKVMFNGNSEDK